MTGPPPRAIAAMVQVPHAKVVHNIRRPDSGAAVVHPLAL